jgi:pyrimidine-nucleoside phosphorylase
VQAAAVRRLIEKKRDGETLASAQIAELVAGYVDGSVDDAPMAAFAMAAVLRGLDDDETFALTRAMIDSGETLALPFAVDKHSSGGVGDSVSLVLVPLVAALGVPVAKLSGRALGHTGGTLDKLEAIPGLRTDLTPAAFAAQIERIGCAIAAQTANLVPADKKLYALRDRTGTVPSVGLIAASIVSKKIAGGAGGIVYDVKCGAGAFLPDVAAARRLATLLVRLTERCGARARAVVSSMEAPLADAIGSGIETIEARDILRGLAGNDAIRDVVRRLAREMTALAGTPADDATIARALADGSAYERFVALVEAQGGTRAALEALREPDERTGIAATHAGFVTGIAPVPLGECSHDLVRAAGVTAGIRLHARVGERVAVGQPLATIYGSVRPAADAATVAAAFAIGAAQPESVALLLDA